MMNIVIKKCTTKIRISKKGKKIIHFEAGQPTAKLPNSAFKQAQNKIKTTNVSYTSPLGLNLLKKKISNYYLTKYKQMGG